ncbi:MAG: RsfS/YbeB/iojap family protein [Planctomycetes bacterium]|nr:RsfS/YbeB/iojap family protein [Planctomycetota bacterium]
MIATGLTSRHLLTAVVDLNKEIRASGIIDEKNSNFHKEGHHGRDGRWVLLDLDRVVVHLFLEESRKYYDLELLWGDCPRADWEPTARPTASS